MDSALYNENVKRCSLPAFSLWLLPWMLILAWGFLGAFLCLYKGLNQTNMDDYFVFALWIVVDLTVIGLGAGAFFTGFLTYIVGKKELKDIINAAVIIGFICYSGAIAMLFIDIGQPTRGWFMMWHVNVHSMLAEVSFCISIYLCVLAVEYIPTILDNRQISRIKPLRLISSNMHEIMAVFAATGTFLSFFHQGSLGGMYGVMFARPFAFRDGIFVWPWTFFLFIISALAVGPCFTILCTKLTEFITRKKLVRDQAIQILAKISGWILCAYVVLKILDTIVWAFGIVPNAGHVYSDFYSGSYGEWLLWFELIVFGAVPALILVTPARQNNLLLILGCLMSCIGLAINRFVFTVLTLAIPVMPFDKFVFYFPSWQEWAISAALLGYGFILFSISYRYLPVFPKEYQLNPVNNIKDHNNL